MVRFWSQAFRIEYMFLFGVTFCTEVQDRPSLQKYQSKVQVSAESSNVSELVL